MYIAYNSALEKFARGLTANTTVYLGFIEALTEGYLNFTHHAAHRTESKPVGIEDEYSERFLDMIEAF